MIKLNLERDATCAGNIDAAECISERLKAHINGCAESVGRKWRMSSVTCECGYDPCQCATYRKLVKTQKRLDEIATRLEALGCGDRLIEHQQGRCDCDQRLAILSIAKGENNEKH